MDGTADLLKIVTERLKASGGRMTKKRERILGALCSMDRPATAEEIRESAKLPPSDLVTVYRNLEAFEKLGVMQRIPLESGTQLFEITAPDEHYHHLICRECHRTERLDVCINDKVITKAIAHGFTEVSHLMEVYGLCQQCSKSS